MSMTHPEAPRELLPKGTQIPTWIDQEGVHIRGRVMTLSVPLGTVLTRTLSVTNAHIS